MFWLDINAICTFTSIDHMQYTYRVTHTGWNFNAIFTFTSIDHIQYTYRVTHTVVNFNAIFTFTSIDHIQYTYRVTHTGGNFNAIFTFTSIDHIQYTIHTGLPIQGETLMTTWHSLDMSIRRFNDDLTLFIRYVNPEIYFDLVH